jgi:hypothetical protein
MLTIETVTTLWDEETESFQEHIVSTLDFEHSLASLSKWEGKWERPFLDKEEKSAEQVYDYLVTMCLTPGVTREQILALSQENFNEINAYIESQQTATQFAEQPNQRGSNQRITAETIYYWMVAFRIPWEAQYWHLNKLLALIRVCNAKQGGKNQKVSRHDLAQRNKDLNEQRRKQYGTSG